ncbi:MAG: Gx transporter family protein [Eubacteriales bacterium]|nr:Gx transporter family protein [Eubacteriales bacterium]
MSRPSTKLATGAILFALTLVFSTLEQFLPPPPLPLPLRWGVANIVVLYAMLRVGPLMSLSLTILKAGFALLVRGVVAAGLSLGGGLMAFCFAFLLVSLFKPSLAFLSIMAAMGHQLGQLMALTVIYDYVAFAALTRIYLPSLIFAYASGTLTAYLLAKLLSVDSSLKIS